MKKCRECGTICNDEMIFCRVCGTMFPSGESMEPERQELPVKEVQTAEPKEEELEPPQPVIPETVNGAIVNNVAKLPDKAEEGQLQFDGLYQYKNQGHSSYLRFFTDGTVVGVSSTGTPEQVALWLNRKYENYGTYSVIDGWIVFDINNPNGVVSYSGRILDDGAMLLDIYSQINGYDAKGFRYQFCRCAALADNSGTEMRCSESTAAKTVTAGITAKQTENILQFDGLYVCQHKDYSSFLRFFEDGLVVGVSSTGAPWEVIGWLTRNFNQQGTYMTSTGWIAFDIFSKDGQVSYRGRIVDKDELKLNSHSYINGNEASDLEYRFFRCSE